MSSALLLEVDEDSCLAGASFAGSSQGASSSAAFGAGLAVHGGSGIALGVIETLRITRPELKFLELVHRLDRDTSGVLHWLQTSL